MHSAMHTHGYLPTPFPLLLCLHRLCTSAPTLMHQDTPDSVPRSLSVAMVAHSCTQKHLEVFGGWECVKSWDGDGGG